MTEKKKKFINWLTSPYLVIIRDEESLAIRKTIRLRKSDLLVYLTLLFFVCQGISLVLTYKVRNAWINPGYAELQTKKMLLNLSEKVDSLADEVHQKDNFILSFKTLIGFSDTLKNETKDTTKHFNYDTLKLGKIEPVDSQLRKEFEGENTGLNFPGKRFENSFLGLNFFTPVNGMITEKFNARSAHYGVDVVSKINEPVKSVLDGTVFMSSWTEDAGYIIGIQHKENLISFYKHNSALLKTVGSFVKAGEVISIIGNTGELTTGPHLHFELWNNGTPVNPEDFISF